jgi:CRP-like cAMP-binding protein
MTIEQQLKNSGFFRGIAAKSLIDLAAICIPKKIDKKEIIFTEGQKGFALFLCFQGDIQLYKSNADGREIVIKVIKPGEVFGEVILFEEDLYPVSALALTKGFLYELPKKQFKSLLDKMDFRDDFIAMLMRKQRYLADQIKYLTIFDVQDRLLKFLHEQYAGQQEIKIHVSKKDIAAAIGTTPETLSRVLLRLKKDGQLQWNGRVITINPSTKKKLIL